MIDVVVTASLRIIIIQSKLSVVKRMSKVDLQDFDVWRRRIIDYLNINPTHFSIVCMIDNDYSECFADTENLVRTFQIMIDSNELVYTYGMGFGLCDSLRRKTE